MKTRRRQAAKGHKVVHCGGEVTGALFPTTVRLIKQAAALAALPDTTDSTVYGINPRNTSSYFTHHVAAISNALVNAEAIILLDAGAKLTRDLTGMPGAA